MSYDDIIKEIEGGINWSELDDAPEQEVLEMKMLALGHLASLHERKAKLYAKDEQQLRQFLALAS
jgi:hypothetical protein